MADLKTTIESTDDAAVTKPRGMSSEVYCENIERFRSVRDRLDDSLGVTNFSVALCADGSIEAEATLTEKGPFTVLNSLLSDGVEVTSFGTGEAVTSASRTQDGETVIHQFVPLRVELRAE